MENFRGKVSFYHSYYNNVAALFVFLFSVLMFIFPHVLRSLFLTASFIELSCFCSVSLNTKNNMIIDYENSNGYSR